MHTEADVRFFRAIALGVAVGVPGTWAVLVAIFAVTTDSSFGTIAGYALVPAFFCGPFLGGLFTTALAASRNERAEHAAHAPAPPAVDQEQRAA